MRILYLAHRVPYPPNKGDKIRSYHHLRHLARDHEVHLLSYYDQPEDAAAAEILRQWCRDVQLIALDTRQALVRGAFALARGRSLSEGYFGDRAMRRAVWKATTTARFDVGWAYSSAMASYLAPLHDLTKVVDYVDVDSEKWRQFSLHARPPLAWAYGLEGRRLRRFETAVAQWADWVLFVSAPEADLFRGFCPQASNLRVVANGVDTSFFRPTHRQDPSATILFTGALDYRPNIDAVLWFARDVLPLIRRTRPDASFSAVGHRPPPALLQAAETSGSSLRIAGSVPDIRPYFADAAVYVAPMTMGRGVQNKILEAMAMRVPVVASPLAVEGLDAEPGTHLLVANTPTDFTEAVLALLSDAALATRLVAAAGTLIEERYAWGANLAVLDSYLQPAHDLQARSVPVLSSHSSLPLPAAQAPLDSPR